MTKVSPALRRAELILTEPVPREIDCVQWRRLFVAWREQLEVPTGDVVVSFISTTAMIKLHEQQLGEAKATDVLSIPYQPAGPALATMPAGEIVICTPVARSQARRLRTTMPLELATLFVHGLIHLLDRDHDTPVEKTAFERDTRAIMETEQLMPVNLWSV